MAPQVENMPCNFPKDCIIIKKVVMLYFAKMRTYLYYGR